LIFTMITTFQSLPVTVVGHYMSNLDLIVHEWISYEDLIRTQKNQDQNRRAPSPNTTTKTPEPKPVP
jgi:hypothetical protein